MKILQRLNLFLFGGVTYGLIELLWRGYTHISMVILGGLCFLILRAIRCTFGSISFLFQCVTSAFIITVMEFCCGCIVNLWLHLNVWSYDNYPFSILGQVCLLYTVFWIALSAVALKIEKAVSGRMISA